VGELKVESHQNASSAARGLAARMAGTSPAMTASLSQDLL
jgi:hypothetical protein